MEKKNFRIIIQVRSGSTRLPSKMLLPLFEEKNILELTIERLLRHFTAEKIVIATTKRDEDTFFCDIAGRYSVLCFRGDEENVLRRFLNAVESFPTENVIRVCADNPFLVVKYIKELIQYADSEYDYVSYRLEDGTPVIRSHLGIFTELVRKSALKKIAIRTKEKKYLEHVTNYIYEHPEEFNIKWLALPEELKNHVSVLNKIRLTVDTLKDFEIAKKLYAKIHASMRQDIDINILFSAIDQESLRVMSEQIGINGK